MKGVGPEDRPLHAAQCDRSSHKEQGYTDFKRTSLSGMCIN